MKKRNHTYTYSIVLAGSLAISQMSGYMVSASAVVPSNSSPAIVAVTAHTVSDLGSIQLGGQFKATLEDVNILPQAGGNILTYTLNYTNASNSNINLTQYFSRVFTPTGSIIPGNPISIDSLKRKVAPKGSLRVTYYANIGQTSSFKGLKIPMYVWDAKAKGYLRQLGSFKLPDNYSPTIATGKSLNTTIKDTTVSTYTESLLLYEYSGKKYAKVGINLTNKGGKVLEDPGYNMYLISAGGSSYAMALDSSQAGYKIQPQENKVVYYFTEIPTTLNTNNMKLQFVQKDEILKFDLPKASYQLPIAITPDMTVDTDVVRTIMINNNTIETQLINASVHEEYSKGMWSFQLRLKNIGKKSVKMPTYDLAVQSDKGTSFPVNAKGLSGITIHPLEEKVIQFTAQIPLEVGQNTLQLEMIESDDTEVTPSEVTTGDAVGKLTLPVAYYTLPYIKRTNTLTGFEYNTTNPYGSFAYNLRSLQRFPWLEEDIIVAKLTITNNQLVTLSLPELKGALKLDHDDLTTSTELFIDKQGIVLVPGKSIDINVLAKIPYTTNFNNIEVSLYSIANDESVPFLTLNTNSMMNAVETIERGGNFMIAGTGKNARVQENKTVVYSGASSNIVYTELLMSNEERRQSKLVRLQAYYRTANGEFYEAISNQPETSVSPGGKQLITFWTKIPKSVSTSNLTLFMGPGITGNKLSEAGQESTGFINISSLELNPVTPAANLAGVSLYPYTLSIQSSDGRLKEGSDSISIDVNYNLFKDSSYDAGAFNHKLILKMTDPNGKSQEKSLVFGSDLTEGNNNTYNMIFSSEQYKSLNGGTYRLTLYDEFQGERIELASQNYPLIYESLPVPVIEE